MSDKTMRLLDQCISEHPLPTCDSYAAMTGAKSEIEHLQSDLTTTKAENEALRGQLEQAKARIKTLETAVPWMEGSSIPAFILRKQAEAVELTANENRLMSLNGEDYALYGDLIYDAQRLRQQADELDRD